MVLHGRDDQRSEVCMSTTTEPVEEKVLTNWERYEQKKAELPSDLSPTEYEAECQKIAKELEI